MALKDLVAAAFGTGTAALGTSTSTLPVISVDDHPDWLRHQQQRNELATALTEANDDVTRLQRERVRAEHDVREADVLRLLGDNVATMAPDAVAADAAIATAQARVAIIAEALHRLDASGAGLRNVLTWQMRGPIEASARELVQNLAKALRDASALNDQLAALERHVAFHLVDVPVRSWRELDRLNENSKLNLWLAAAQAIGWDG